VEIHSSSSGGGRHALGEELRAAHSTGEKRRSCSVVPRSSLDVSVAVTGSGGIKFWVVNGEAGTTDARTARVKVNLYRG
jgi:Trypsin-co-occurring domain 2